MPSPTDRQRTIEFFERWGVSFEEMEASFRETFAPACVWEQRPMAVTTGPDEAVRFLRRARTALGVETVEVDLRNISATGGIVHTERMDHLRRADGGLIVSAPVAGVLEWQDGRIVSWREYFDSASFVGRALPRLAAAGFQRIRSQFA
ncbi:MAG: limonene,2-epoxide hydrolase [Thermoleophilaceae bacterium]|jgi:limonene-1,2-epoxide hydrolase|nr:limonene,2-epoxide hydrolase [Thermoleophilaceae bacterium]